MCIIAIQPKGKKISDNILRNCWDNNNDGAGIMYAIDGKIIVHKELTSFDRFMKYKKSLDLLDMNIVFHFRISTSGKVDSNNIHPFKVNKELYFCHNGILNIEVPNDSLINDTQIYNNGILKNLPKGFEYNSGIMNLIRFSIGAKNKFVFLDNKGDFFIINEEAGTWDGEIWYSNSTYEYSYSSSYSYTKKGYSPFTEFDAWEPIECEACTCRSYGNNLNYNTEWDMYLCNTCNDFAKVG
jgi:glutamine amidotransferase